MQNMVKLIAIAAALLLASCHSDVPSLPSISEMQYCKYEKADGAMDCESLYVISREECESEAVEGKVVDSCEE